MGIVERTINVGRYPDGYPMEDTFNFVYCDRCGSFNIKTYITLKIWVIISIVVLGSAAVWNYIYSFAFPNLNLVVWWGIFVVSLMLTLAKAWTYLGHACRSCGNKRITYDDILNYQTTNKYILDVTELYMHKHDKHYGRWYDDVIHFPLFLTIFLILMLFPLIMLFAVIYYGIKNSLQNRSD